MPHTTVAIFKNLLFKIRILRRVVIKQCLHFLTFGATIAVYNKEFAVCQKGMAGFVHADLIHHLRDIGKVNVHAHHADQCTLAINRHHIGRDIRAHFLIHVRLYPNCVTCPHRNVIPAHMLEIIGIKSREIRHGKFKKFPLRSLLHPEHTIQRRSQFGIESNVHGNRTCRLVCQHQRQILQLLHIAHAVLLICCETLQTLQAVLRIFCQRFHGLLDTHKGLIQLPRTLSAGQVQNIFAIPFHGTTEGIGRQTADQDRRDQNTHSGQFDDFCLNRSLHTAPPLKRIFRTSPFFRSYRDPRYFSSSATLSQCCVPGKRSTAAQRVSR